MCLKWRRNIFVYLIAGHETTAHTLTYMFELLALYPAEQKKIYQQIVEVLGSREAVRKPPLASIKGKS